MKYVLLALLFINSTAFAMLKALPLGKTDVIDYEVPDDWDVSRKEASKDAPVKILRIKKNNEFVILALFMKIEKDNPVFIKTGSMDEYIKYYHSIATKAYVESSLEEMDHPQTVNIKSLSGLRSSFTENPKQTTFESIADVNDNFNHAMIATHIIGDKEKGIVVSMAYLSNEISSQEYNLGLKAIDSFSLEESQSLHQDKQVLDYATPSVTPMYFLGCSASTSAYLEMVSRLGGDENIEPSEQTRLAKNFVTIASLLNKGKDLKELFTAIFSQEIEKRDQVIRSEGMGKYIEMFLAKEHECRQYVSEHQNELLGKVK